MRGTTTTLLAILAAAVLVLPALGVAPMAGDEGVGSVHASADDEDGPDSDGHSAEATTVTSFDGTEIAITVFRPAGASSSAPVPVLLHGHGWSGSRWDVFEFDRAAPYLGAGFGVVSIDMRGHGDSGGQAHVQDPEFEARDVMAVIDHVAGLDWVLLDDASADDPRLGALGGSYGGGYQLITALEETRLDGDTRFDALAPEITWYSLPEALAPGEVPRSVWIDLLYGAAKATGTDVAPYIDEAYAEYLATGEPGEAIAVEFHEHSPAWYVEQGVHLDVPALFLQGLPDTLFPFDHAWDNYHETLTADARDDSLLIGHLGGHILNTEGTLGTAPSPVPVGLQPAAEGDPCSEEIAGGQTELRVAWYRYHLLGDDALVPPGGVQWAVDAETCWPPDGIHSISLVSHDADPVTPVGTAAVALPAGTTQYLALADGARTVVGAQGSVQMTVSPATPPGTDARVFFALAAGSGPDDVRILDSQWTPVGLGGGDVVHDVDVDLVRVSGEVAEDETLYLAVSTWVDQFAHDANRVPAAVVLQDVEVWVPQA